MRSGKKSATPLKVYEIEFSNAFPYEQAIAVHVANPGEPIALSAEMDKDRMHRIYRNHPFQHVSWALMEGFERYDYSPESLAGKKRRPLGPDRLRGFCDASRPRRPAD